MFNVKFSLFLGIYPGTLSCIVKLPDEVGISHTKCVGDKYKTILQLEKLSAAHCMVYPFKNIFKIFCHCNHRSRRAILECNINFYRLVLRVNRTLVDQICMWTPLKFLCYGQYSLS